MRPGGKSKDGERRGHKGGERGVRRCDEKRREKSQLGERIGSKGREESELR